MKTILNPNRKLIESALAEKISDEEFVTSVMKSDFVSTSGNPMVEALASVKDTVALAYRNELDEVTDRRDRIILHREYLEFSSLHNLLFVRSMNRWTI